jgi:RHS repeat-associated protein
MAEQRQYTYGTPYKFNGKESDEETGLYYYSPSRPQDGRSRYYDPKLSIFASIDRFTEKLPDQSPYTYAVNSNLLMSVTDNGPITLAKPKGFNPGTGGIGYGYDAAGNLKSDTYKGITNITYNFMNLPVTISWGSTKSIEFVYDASGQKLSKTVKTGSTTNSIQDYVMGIEYNKLGAAARRIEAVYHAEGRYFNTSTTTTPTWRTEYSIKDHLGNTRVTFTDKNNNAKIDVTNSASTNEILQENHYYAFGMNYEGGWMINDAARDNPYQYNGKEYNADHGLNWSDYGARWYDACIGRWMAVDPLAHEYPSVSPYVYVLNNPINAIDPDGRRVYFVGGANNDLDGWNYINRWKSAFSNSGINDFVRVNASHGKAGDVMFTNSYRNSGTYDEYRMRKDPGGGMYREYTGRELPVNNSMINSTVKLYKQQLADNPLKEGEQFNLAGYSYGSVLQAQAALKLANDGVVVDNLVLIGSPISDDSKLYQQLSGNKNIKNIIRIDIPTDKLSNPESLMEFIQGGWQNRNDSGPHFDLARPGTDKAIQQAVDQIKKDGVKN